MWKRGFWLSPAPSTTILTLLLVISPLACLAASSWGTPEEFTSTNACWSVDTADFDNDGTLDVLAMGNGDGIIRVALNKDGLMDTPLITFVTSSFAGASSAKPVDVNDDGLIDVIGSAWAASFDLGYYLNQGGGAFSATKTVIESLPNAYFMEVGVFNSDNRTDVILALPTVNSLYLYDNQGDGTFSRQTISTSATGVNAVGVGDWNGDGHNDFCVTIVGSILVYTNDGSGGFTSTSINSGENPNSCGFCDFDGDGDLDLMTGKGQEDKLEWWRVTAGSWAWVAIIDYPVNPQLGSCIDIDGDGDYDWVHTVHTDNEINAYENTDGAGTFSGPTTLYSLTQARGLAIADMDQDGDHDVVYCSDLSGEAPIGWIPNTNRTCGDGVIQVPETCDDGNNIAGDGCTAFNCLLEICGDGIINNNDQEQCDDGNTVSGDGCSNACVIECPVGQVSNTTSADDCSACPINTIPDKANLPCVPCAGGTITLDEGSTQCICPTGMYGNDEAGCTICPENAGCDEPGLEDPVTLPGYWRIVDAQGQISFVPCPGGAAACPGADSGETSVACEAGYTGFLCSTCDDNYYATGSTCTACSTSTSSIFIALGALVGLGFVIYRLTGKGSSTPSVVILGTIFINYAQTMSILPSYSIPWPDSITALFSWMSIANFNIELAAPECQVSLSVFDKAQLTMALPLAAAALTLAAALTVAILRPILCKMSPEKEYSVEEKGGKTAAGHPSLIAKLFGTLVSIFVILYTTVTSAAVNIFNCTTYNGADFVLTSSPSIACYDEEWSQTATIAGIAIAGFSLGLPLLMGIAFLTSKSSSRTQGAGAWTAIWGSVSTFKYDQTHFWYEIVLLGRKALLISIALLPSAFTQSLALFITTFGYIVIQSWTRPYYSGGHNTSELFASISTFLTVFAGILYTGDGYIPDNTAESVVSAMVMTGAIITMLLVLKSALDEVKGAGNKLARVAPAANPKARAVLIASSLQANLGPERASKVAQAIADEPVELSSAMMQALEYVAAEEDKQRDVIPTPSFLDAVQVFRTRLATGVLQMSSAEDRQHGIQMVAVVDKALESSGRKGISRRSSLATGISPLAAVAEHPDNAKSAASTPTSTPGTPANRRPSANRRRSVKRF